MDVGAHLRSSREAQGISIALLAARTRVQPRILTAIELNDLDGIPPKPYGRGFVRAYAHELGLDPERVVHDYFGQFPAAAPAPPPPRVVADPSEWNGVAAFLPAAVTILIGIGIVALLWQNARSVDAPALTPAVGTTGVAPAPAAAPVRTDPAPASPAPSAPDHLTLVIRASRDCWVTASADGQRVVYQLLSEGSERSLTASREIVLRAGDAGALRLIVNGRDAGAFGQSGEVRQARITPGNAAALGSVSGQ
jgi:cytoskeletal protein RodZ